VAATAKTTCHGNGGDGDDDDDDDEERVGNYYYYYNNHTISTTASGRGSRLRAGGAKEIHTLVRFSRVKRISDNRPRQKSNQSRFV
jgi:hypothetical protein